MGICFLRSAVDGEFLPLKYSAPGLFPLSSRLFSELFAEQAALSSDSEVWHGFPAPNR
jgi:hypothetical protein